MPLAGAACSSISGGGRMSGSQWSVSWQSCVHSWRHQGTLREGCVCAAESAGCRGTIDELSQDRAQRDNRIVKLEHEVSHVHALLDLCLLCLIKLVSLFASRNLERSPVFEISPTLRVTLDAAAGSME